MKCFIIISVAAGLTWACRTPQKNETGSSGIKSADHMEGMQRIGDNYVITCLDATIQTVPVDEFGKLLASEICPNVLTSECQPSIKYKNGKDLKQAGGSYNYSNGQALKSGGGTIFFNNAARQVFKSATGTYFYPSGIPLRSSGGTFSYMNGQELKSQSGIYYYPNKKVLKQNSGVMFYPNGDTLKAGDGGSLRTIDGTASNQGTFYYLRQDKNKDQQVMKGNSGSFFYRDGAVARAGSILYRPDKSLSVAPLLLEENVGEFGTLRYAVDKKESSFSLSLPTLSKEVGMTFDPKTGEFFMRFLLTENDAPIILEVDSAGALRFDIWIATGYPGERIVLSGTGNSNEVQCKAVHAVK